MRVGNLIFGSLTPRFPLAARAAIQSESPPLVARLMREPTNRAKFIKPTVWLEKFVRRGSEVLGLRQVDGQETAGRPRHDEGGELDDREGEKSPGDPGVPRKSLDPILTRRE